MEPTYTPYEMEDGSIVPLSLNYGLLLRLRSADKGAYRLYKEALKQANDDPEYVNLVILYTSYTCGYILDNGNTDGLLSLEDFAFSMNQDRNYNGEIAKEISAPKQKKASGKRS